MGVWYATREDVKASLNSGESARNNAQLDRIIEAVSRGIDSTMHRVFYPMIDTRYFDWPDDQSPRSWRLWLEEDEVLAVTSITSGGATVGSSDYFLRPDNAPSQGIAYHLIEMSLAGPGAWAAGSTPQRAVSVAGTFGGVPTEEVTAGALAASISSAGATTATVTDASAIGTGTVIKVDSERMLVTARNLITTGQTLSAGIDDRSSTATVPVSSGSALAVGEMITVDAERMMIVDIAGNNLLVMRAVDGSVLAVHSSGATVYAPRLLGLSRGALGTTAATHSNAAPVSRLVIPVLIRQLAVAEAVALFEQETAGYGRVAGSGDNSMPVSGVGLKDIRCDAETRYRRKVRMRVI